ncbi:MAG TPA: DUF1080 domain-containing protein [Planctomycetaceae bacterium]|nr:DUF1080 domain-containing protein [Planctomycetaceae bacterium]HQZ66637.1 DUF1080 domain-containing protein [Planctomycetaceae bacterium]
MKFVLPVFALILCTAIASPVMAQPYTNLLQDRSLDSWMLPSGDAVEKGWSFDEDGALHLVGKGNNILSRDEYQEFELWFDFRISEKGNSGIKYRVQKFGSAWLGLEYQIQDDAAFPKQAAKHQTAGLYDLIDRSNPILERRYLPRNEWSTGHIVVQNNRLRHWMNGNIIIDEHSDSQHFTDAVEHSKFKNTAGFGRNPSGRIMLTDHGTEVWYRNLYVRRLDCCPPLP